MYNKKEIIKENKKSSKFYISVPQGRTCRYSSKDSPDILHGLYTDNFSSCNIVIFYTMHLGELRISMSHVDNFFNKKQLAEELKWIFHNYKADWSDAKMHFAFDIVHKNNLYSRVLQHEITTSLRQISGSFKKLIDKWIRKNTFTKVQEDCFGLLVNKRGLHINDKNALLQDSQEEFIRLTSNEGLWKKNKQLFDSCYRIMRHTNHAYSNYLQYLKKAVRKKQKPSFFVDVGNSSNKKDDEMPEKSKNTTSQTKKIC